MIKETDLSEVISKTRQVTTQYCKHIELVFICHGTGQRTQKLQACLDERENGKNPLSAPACNLLRHCIKSNAREVKSALLGVAISHDTILTFLKKPKITAFISLNTDKYETVQDCTYDIYAHLWHIVAIYEKHKTNQSKQRDIADRTIVPKQATLDKNAVKLREDIFACALASFFKQENIVNAYGMSKAQQLLSAEDTHALKKAYFLLVFDKVRFLLDDTLSDGASVSDALKSSYYIAEVIEETVTKDDYTRGDRYTAIIKKMARQNISPPYILTTLIDGSDDIDIKKTGLLISNLLKIEPVEVGDIAKAYNTLHVDTGAADQSQHVAVNEYVKNIVPHIKSNNAFSEGATAQ